MSELMDLIIACENQLGWTGPATMNIYRARAIEVGKLRGALSRRRDLTVKDLRLAIAYCVRRREPITSPLQLLGKVDEAKALALQRPRASNLAMRHTRALAWEQTTADRDSSRWITRLVRSHGPARAEVLAEWEAAGRGEGHAATA